jgi:hypothetical protein
VFKRLVIGVYLGLCLLFFPNATRADESPWEFRFTPYLWLPALNTDLRIGTNPPTESDSSTDLLDVLDFAFLANGEVRKGDWGFIGEFNYLALSNDASYAGGLFNATNELDGIMGGAALAYRFYKNDRLAVDALGGFRIWSLEATIDYDRLPTVSRTKTWVDPLVGIRGHFDLTESFFVDGLADVGGFGVGSDFQWEVSGRAGYRFNDTFSIAAGYRHLSVHFDKNALDIDAALTGPFLALDVTW